MEPVITVFAPFTRRWAVEKWIEGFEAQKYPKDKINLRFIVDCDEPDISIKLQRMNERGGYRSYKMKMNVDNAPNEVRISARRLRIVDMKNESKALVADSDGNIVVCFEDDAVFTDDDTIWKLVRTLIQADQIGFVEGVQCGRWGTKMVGAWQADDFYNPSDVKTLLPPEVKDGKRGLQEITGGGFYGYATRRHLYLEHVYNSEPEELWGPDVNYGFWVRQQGFSCVVDWDIIFLHNDYGKLLEPLTGLTQICYTKDNTTNAWSRTDVEQSS